VHQRLIDEKYYKSVYKNAQIIIITITVIDIMASKETTKTLDKLRLQCPYRNRNKHIVVDCDLLKEKKSLLVYIRIVCLSKIALLFSQLSDLN
jgi:hypothetical protein